MKARKKKIPKRDQAFQRAVARLPHSWLIDHQLLIVAPSKHAPQYALAGQWRPEIYHTQRWISYSLVMAYTNKHKNVHSKFGRMMLKGYFLCFGLALLPACGDKLGQLLREFLEIKEWLRVDKQGQIRKTKAKESKTHLIEVIKYLRITNCNPQIQQALENYWNNKNREKAYKLANRLKHGWAQHYLGIKTKIAEHITRDKKGNITAVSFGTAPVSEKTLYKDISILRKANNLFVKCAEEIDKIIDFEQFYEVIDEIKDGRRILKYKLKGEV